MERDNRPKIGFALSGAAARSVFYIGFLEVMKENDIPIDVITAQSGATIVASAFACGTLDQLKKDFIPIDKTKLRQLLQRSKQGGGIYTLDHVEEYGREHWTLGKRFDEVSPRLCFVAANLTTGELMPLAMGDIAHAVRISCSVPGLFVPVTWGNSVLVDGGLISFIPSDLARESGADLVIGVNVRATQHIFLKHQIKAKHAYNVLKRWLFFHRLGKLWKRIAEVVKPTDAWDYFEPLEYAADDLATPGMFSVLGKSLDLAAEASRLGRNQPKDFGCDLLIREGTGNFGDSVRTNDMVDLYNQGRNAALAHLPEIKMLIENWRRIAESKHLVPASSQLQANI